MSGGNKYLIADKSKLLKKKLENLSVNMSGKLGNASLQTQEAYINEINKIIGEFYISLQEPQLSKESIETIRVDDLPDVEIYNKIFQQIIDDLTTIFTELENVEDLTLSNFNFITTESNRLTSRLKAVDSKLGDYTLFSLSPTKDIFFYKDSFNDLSKVDVNSNLLNSAECEVNQAEGIVTLPINKGQDSTIIVKKTPIINPSSNGIAGNSYEIGATYNGNMAVLSDDNPDTWFEYERVVSKSVGDKEPLVLDITMNLGEEKIINHIRVNPNNFGTKTIIEIDDISTSIDGQIYTSIKDDIPIAGFSSQDEENIFSLAPSTSKFAGQGLYTFTPRKVRYIRFVFEQAEPYIIDTTAGERLRYAIGIRDIDIKCYNYEAKGELVSEPFESTKEIRKVLLETNQNPTQQSELANIQYFVSPDDGASWHELKPKGFTGPTGADALPEILDFNTGDTDAIETPVPVKAVRLKTVFVREEDKFEEGSSSLNKKIITKSELQQVPQASPFTLDLEESPVDGTVTVVDPLFGSRGVPEAQYIVGHAVDRLDTRRFRLPFTNFPRPMQKTNDGGSPPTYHTEPAPASDYIHVEAGGEEWAHATQPLSDYTFDSNNPQNYKFFVFDPNTGILEFGDNISTTAVPEENQPIGVWFSPERLFPNEIENDHVAQLDFSTSSNKDDFTIKRYDKIQCFTEVIPRKATVIELTNSFVLTTSGIGSELAKDSFNVAPETFVNGREELQGNVNSWSIDTDRGVIYTARPTSATTDISVSYTYQPIVTLTTAEWDWADTDLLRDSISIKESAWQTIQIEEEELPSTADVKVLDVSKMSVVKGTLDFSVTVSGSDLSADDITHPFVTEVDYINGVEELGGEFLKTTENISNNLNPTANVASFTLKEKISTQSSQHPVTFSNTTLFETDVGASTPSNTGEYSVNHTTGVVSFYTTTVQTYPGTITYLYPSPRYSSTGLYSVNYKLGKIYTQRPINSLHSTTCDYQYTDYRAEYKIARFLELDSYDVDITNKTITIKDKEILKHLLLPHGQMDTRTPLYLVNYDYVVETREDIENLKDKFTPVLKDYALRILTKGRII